MSVIFTRALTVWDFRVAWGAIIILQLHTHAAQDPPLSRVRFALQPMHSRLTVQSHDVLISLLLRKLPGMKVCH